MERLRKQFSTHSSGQIADQLAEAVIWSDFAVSSFNEHSWILYKSERKVLHTSECAVIILDMSQVGGVNQTIYFPISPNKGLVIHRLPVVKHGWFPLTEEKIHVFNNELLELTKTHVVFGQDSPEFLSVSSPR